MALIGRDAERRVVDELLESARGGSGSTLVIRGEPGIGKTSLLAYAEESAADFLVIRLTGFEPERDVGFAALHRLLTPILHQIDRLPAPQRDAMHTALGLSDGPPATPLLLGLGTSALASNAVRAAGPMLCIFDDAQWIDPESLAPLTFWARRIGGEGTVVIFGERTPEDADSPLDGFRVLEVGGLDVGAARELLAAAPGKQFDRELLGRLVTDTGGNPLALVELAKDVGSEQLLGAGASLQPLPIGPRMEQRFASQVRALPVESQMMLLLAAADSSGDPAVMSGAAHLLGVAPHALEAAEAAGLIGDLESVTFRHPLIRSAVYGAARPADRRAVHAALAAATDADSDPERRAWHLAGATVGADEEVATALEQCAARSVAKGSHPAAIALLCRAAELSPTAERASARRVAAAEAALAGGASAQAGALVALARPDLPDDATRARADRVEGCVALIAGRVDVAAPMLMSAGVALLATDVQLGRHTLLEALDAAFMSSNAVDHPGTTAIASAALEAPPCGDALVDALLDAFATYVCEGFGPAVPLLRTAVAVACGEDIEPAWLIRWSFLASSITWALWDHDGHVDLMARLDSVRRDAGSINWLAVGLQSRARLELMCGRFEAADDCYAQATAMYADLHRTPGATEIVGVHAAALRGDGDQGRAAAATVLAIAGATGLGVIGAAAHDAMVLLEMGCGHYAEALEHAQALVDHFPISLASNVLPDIVEAATRLGDERSATIAIEQLTGRATASGSVWAMGVLARSRALLDGPDGETSFHEAIELIGSTPLVLEQARTHLLYGEFLRRAGRRADARAELQLAHDMFSSMGAMVFAGRAAAEIRATGDRVRPRDGTHVIELTPQEAAVAHRAAAGHTNAEIAGQLFISEHTVSYHLRKVYRKLGVSSRRQLTRALPAEQLSTDG